MDYVNEWAPLHDPIEPGTARAVMRDALLVAAGQLNHELPLGHAYRTTPKPPPITPLLVSAWVVVALRHVKRYEARQDYLRKRAAKKLRRNRPYWEWKHFESLA